MVLGVRERLCVTDGVKEEVDACVGDRVTVCDGESVDETVAVRDSEGVGLDV